jgi:hypothetical protein
VTMIQHVWSVLCSRSLIDRETNNITLFEAIEQVKIGRRPPRQENAPEEGLLPIRVELVTLWIRSPDNEPTQGRTRSAFVRPSGVMTEAIVEHDIDLRTNLRNRHRHRFAGIPVREGGRHVFRVDVWNDTRGDWEEVAAVPLEIIFTAD